MPNSVTIKHKGETMRTQSKSEQESRSKEAIRILKSPTGKEDPKLSVRLRNRDKGQALSPKRLKRMKRIMRRSVILGR